MSLTISVSPDEVGLLLAGKGIPCRFTEQERMDLSTTPVVSAPQNVFAYPVPEDNSGLTISNLRKMFGTDPRHPPSFHDHPWYQDEAFTKVPAATGWHLLLT